MQSVAVVNLMIGLNAISEPMISRAEGASVVVETELELEELPPPLQPAQRRQAGRRK